MKLETFFEKFDLFADAPNAVAKMRELVLQLAVEGGLVPHSAAEPAVPYASVEDATPINVSDVPENWRVVLLSDAIKNRSGNSKLIKGKLHEESAAGRFQGFSASGADVWCDDYEHEGQAIIISAVGARCGKAFKASGKWCAIANTNITRPEPTLFDFDFAYLVLNNEHFWVRGGSAQPFVKFPPSLDRHFALPPLAEQKRIVANVDELMALCDRLEAQQQERETRHAALARASLARFADAPTPANLDFLFHSSFIIPPSDLRKSILTLAVQGKLVPQDPNDEPAEGLLGVLKSKQTELFAKEGLRARKPVTGLGRSDWPFEFPASWDFPCFDDVMVIVSGVTKGRKLAGRKTISLPYLRVANVQRGYLVLDVIKEIEVLEEDLDRYRLLAGDVLMTEGGDWDKLGRAAIWNDEIIDCIHQNHVYRVRSGDKRLLLPAWTVLFANSPPGRSFFANASKQTTNLASINMTQLRGCPLPLPPLAEQRRIVAKVEQLMALVDALETQLAASRATSANLLSALVAELTGTPNNGKVSVPSTPHNRRVGTEQRQMGREVADQKGGLLHQGSGHREGKDGQARRGKNRATDASVDALETPRSPPKEIETSSNDEDER